MVLLEGQLERGIIPEDSTWILEPPQQGAGGRSGQSSDTTTALMQLSSIGSRALAAPVAAALAVAAPNVPGEGRLQLTLVKLNLELYET